MRRRSGIRYLAAGCLAAASACGGDGPTEPPPAATQLKLFVAPPPTAQSGVLLSSQPVVQLADAQGAAVATAGVAITASVDAGSISGTATITTGADGRVAFQGLAVAGPAGTRTLSFGAPQLSAVSHSLALASGGAALIAPNAATTQTAGSGRPAPIVPSVLVTDAAGNPVAGAAVTFAVIAGAGSVIAGPAATGTDGVATVASWTLGIAAGENKLRAMAAGVADSVVFQAFGTLVTPALMAAFEGGGQTANRLAAVSVAPAVRVTDAGGLPVAGVAVTFEVTEGGGSVTDAARITDVEGVARVGSWVLGGVAGVNELTASAPGVPGSPVLFSATGLAIGTISAFAGTGQTALPGAAVSVRPVARILDGFGDPVAGVPVTFRVASGGGTITGAAQVTNGAGQATIGSWKLGPSPGVNELHAEAEGVELSPAVFTATAVDDPATIEMAGGNGQTAGVRRLLPLDLGVKHEDRYGNPVPGQDVILAMPDQGEISDIRVSGADGITRFKWRLGPATGTQTITATSPEVPGQSVVFTATATAVVSNFAIDLRILGSIAPAHRAVFDAAVARWRDIILADVPSTMLDLAAEACFDGQPRIDETVDDILIYVQVVPLDGLGGLLGQAGPCVIRAGSFLPVMGLMLFDSDDLDDLAIHGELSDVILHEMGHVLGFGTTWLDHGLLSGPGTANPRFTGAFARAAYQVIGGIGDVPVENTGGPGTQDGHWRESVFANELMTGFIGGFPNPLSAITIGSLRDLGYGVDYGTADPFGGTAGLRRERNVRFRQLRERPLERPILVTQPDGRIVGQRPR